MWNMNLHLLLLKSDTTVLEIKPADQAQIYLNTELKDIWRCTSD